jgi:exodeoxyribonuclease VII large subunit
MRYFLSQRRHHIRDLQTHRGFRQLELLVRRRHQQLDELSSSLGLVLRLRIATARQRMTRAGAQILSFDLRARATLLRQRVEQQGESLRAAVDRTLIAKRHRYEKLKLQLDERSPLELLERGYSIAYDASGKVLRSVDQVALGDGISVRLARGLLDASVRKKRDT